MKFDIVTRMFRYAVRPTIQVTAEQKRAARKLIAYVEKCVANVYSTTILVQELCKLLARADFDTVFAYALEIHRGWTRTTWTRRGPLLIVVNRGFLEDYDLLWGGAYLLTPQREAELTKYQEALDRALVAFDESHEVTIMTAVEAADAIGLGDDDSVVRDVIQYERMAYTGSGRLYLIADELVLIPKSLL